jgi:chromosome partitioning protein
MTTIFALGNQKGGVGRSTLAVSLAAYWLERGRKVLLVDADEQATARTWVEVALEHERPAPTVIAMGVSMHRRDQLPRLAPAYDIVIIDTPARLGEVQGAAMLCADVVIVPCGPSAHECWAMAESVQLVDKARSLRPELEACIVITRRIARTTLGHEAREVLEKTGLPVLDAELGHRVDYQEASAAGRGVTSYAPQGEAASEVRSLAAELELFARGRKIRASKRAAKEAR